MVVPERSRHVPIKVCGLLFCGGTPQEIRMVRMAIIAISTFMRFVFEFLSFENLIVFYGAKIGIKCGDRYPNNRLFFIFAIG